MKYTLLFLAIIGLATLIFYNQTDTESTPYQDWNKIMLGREVLNIEVVYKPEDLQKGLSGRSNLPTDQGLLFVFDREDIHRFWMRDMNFPIDILWLDEKMKVVYIKEVALPTSYPEVFTPTTKAKYVLETPAQFVANYGIKIGYYAEILE